MKLRILFFAMGLSISAWSQVAHTILVNGNVFDSITGVGIPNYPVYINDSSSAVGGGISLTLFTDANGYYNDTVQLYSTNGMLLVQTQDSCNGNWYSDYLAYTGNTPSFYSIYSAFGVCGSFSGGGGSSGSSCHAGFVFDSTLTGMGQIVLYNTSYVDSAMQNATVNYTWNFGDGTLSNAAYPSHTYTSAGSFALCLTIDAFDGVTTCSNTYCDSIVVDSSGNVSYKDISVVLNVYNPSQMEVKESEMEWVTIYPNPSQGETWVSLPETSELRLYSITGQCIYHAMDVIGEMALPYLTAGTYVLDVSCSKGTTRELVLIQ